MIIYLYGPDSYRRNKKLQELIQVYRLKHEQVDLFIVDLEEEPDSWLKAKEFLNQPSMFVDTKVAIVKESSAAADEKEWIVILKAERATPKTLVFISDSTGPKKAFQFLLEPPVRAQFFAELKDRLLDAFLKQETARQGLRFTEEAWRFFASYIAAQEEKSWVAVKELEKIALAKFTQPVSYDALEKVIHWTAKDEMFFALQRLLQTKIKEQKLGLLEKLLLQKEALAYIFNSLAYQARGQDIIRLADYDVAVKSGRLEYEEALTDFVIT